MLKKHKDIKETNIELNTSTKWVIVLAVITLFIVLNILGTRSLIIKTWNKLRPTPTPTPSQKINISPAEGLNTDQASYAKLAIENLAARLKLKKEEITLQSVKQKDWNFPKCLWSVWKRDSSRIPVLLWNHLNWKRKEGFAM